MKKWKRAAFFVFLIMMFLDNTSILAADSALNVKPSGNVGIGTTAPAAKLDVNGNIHATGDICTDANGRCLSTAGAGGGGSVWNSNANGDINYSSGNVGIGTSAPAAKLHVDGDVQLTPNDKIYVVGNSTNSIEYYNGSTGAMVLTSGAAGVDYPMSFFQKGSERMTIKNGNVGIGMTGPTNKLDIYGDTTGYTATSYNDSAQFRLRTSDENGDYSGIRFTNVSGFRESFFGVVQGDANDKSNFVFQGYDGTSHTYKEFMRISDIGNVGINSSPGPNYKLDVSADSGKHGIIGRAAAGGAGVYGYNGGGGIAVEGYSSGWAGYFTGPGYLSVSAWTYGSDRRMKENIRYLTESGLEKVMQLKPAKFDYIKGQKKQIGFIAQDVQDVIPEAVSVTDEKTGMLGLKADFIVPYLVNAIKEHQMAFQEQQKEIKELKMAIETLQKENKK